MNLQHNFRKNKKGIGTVFGMVFFLLIVMVVFASFVIVLNQNTSLEQTVIQTRQMDNDKASEQVAITGQANATSTTSVTVNCTLTSNGALPVQIIRLWVKDQANEATNSRKISYLLQQGIPQLCYTQVPLTVANPVSDIITFWFETARGNQISLQSVGEGTTTIIQNINVSPTQIGAIQLNWSQFNFYDFGTTNPGASKTLPSQSTYGYTVPSNHYILMNVTLTNLDTLHRSITLTSDTYVYGVAAKNGNGNTAFSMDIAKVTGNTYYSSPAFTTQVLNYNTPTNVFFGAVVPGNDGTTLPFNMVLFGYLTQTGATYGQNIPFVTLKFTSSAAAYSLSVSGFPSPITAGVSGSVLVTAKDAFGNTATGYVGTVHFTSTDSIANLPLDYAFTTGAGKDNGIHAFSVTLKTSGTQSISVNDTVTGTLAGSQTGIQVNPAPASTLVVSGFPSPITAGISGSVIVTAKDAFGFTTPSYLGTIHFISSDAQASLPVDYTFVAGDNGVHTFSVTLKNAGTQSITATDITTPSITGNQNGIVVTAAAASQLVLTNGRSQVLRAGAISGATTVQRQDQFNNPASSGTTTIGLSSTSVSGTFSPSITGLPTVTSVTISSGVSTATFYYQDNVAGIPTLTVSSAGLASDTTQFTIMASKLVVTGGAGQGVVAGQGSNVITITREDASGVAVTIGGDLIVNLGTTSGSGTFSTSATGSPTTTAVIIASGSSTSTFYYQDTAAGTPTLTESATGLSSGTTQFTVNPAPANHLVVSSGLSQVAATAFSVTVTAKDTFSNTATGYLGTIHFISSDAQASLPVDYTFVAGDIGSKTFTNGVILKTAGTQSVTATDTVTISITGSQAGITVNPVSTTTSTSLSAATITIGSSITDTATVAPSVATGTITFQYSINSGLTWASFGATKTLVSGSATSDSYSPTYTGTYYFRAVYSGDLTYSSSQSINTAEPLKVNSAQSLSLDPNVNSKQTSNTISSNQVALSVTTTNPNDIVYISIVESNGQSITGINSNPALNWVQRKSLSFSTSTTNNLETWYAVKASSGAVTITITFNNNNPVGVSAFAISGANTLAPFDSNGPTTSTGNGQNSASISFTTSGSNELLIASIGTTNIPSSLNSNNGMTIIGTQASSDSSRLTSAEYKTTTSAQAYTAGYAWASGSGNRQDWGMIADAVKAP